MKSEGRSNRQSTTKVLLCVIAAIASLSPLRAWGDVLQLNATVDTPNDQPLTLTTASQYLSDSNFYAQSWDPALMALGTGSGDPAYRSIIDVRRFQSTGQAPSGTAATAFLIPFPTEEARANSAIALDAGPMPCPGGFAIRTVDSFGAVHTIRITSATQADAVGQGVHFTKLMAMTPQDEDWARQLIHVGQEIGRKHTFTTKLGSNQLTFSAQLNPDRQAALGNEPLVNGAITLSRGTSFSMSLNPSPIYDNQVVSRINLAFSKPGSSTHFTVRNLAWRRATSYTDATQVDGGAWVAGVDTNVTRRTSLSAAVSAWDGDGARGTDTVLTGQYRASSDRIYGLGLMTSSEGLGPFASYAQKLRGGGRLYLSVGAPLDDRTRVPVACRMTLPL